MIYGEEYRRELDLSLGQNVKLFCISPPRMRGVPLSYKLFVARVLSSVVG